ncbi:unannotated protein [freshwater metagenome]|uniref:Unannotated protein n=1 Tax=freshwater metagenome TaxID=449393 RepID=A0A6J5YDY0_9ZZZZ
MRWWAAAWSTAVASRLVGVEIEVCSSRAAWGELRPVGGLLNQLDTSAMCAPNCC